MTNRREVQFTHFLRDDLSQPEFIESLREQMPDVEIDDKLAEKIGRPFYEVRLDCVLDTKTGKVSIIGAQA